MLTIGELARLAQVSTRSLRYYEEQGLLTPARTSEGHRRYPPGALRCVKLFKALFDAGMTSALVREAVAKWHANRTPDVAAILRVRHAEITEQIARQTAALRLRVEGGGAVRGGATTSFGDHRLGMAAATLAATLPCRTLVESGTCHRTSFPEFVTVMNALGLNIRMAD